MVYVSALQKSCKTAIVGLASRDKVFLTLPRRLWSAATLILLVDLAWFFLSSRLAIKPLDVASLLLYVAGIAALFTFTQPPETGLRYKLYKFFAVVLFCGYSFVAMRLLNYATMSVPLPMADGLLSTADQLVGLNWRAYAYTVITAPDLVTVLKLAYNSLVPIGLTMLAVLYMRGRYRHGDAYVELSFWTSLLVTVVGMAFPAYGTVAYFASHTVADALGQGAGTYHIVTLERLRGGATYVLGMNPMPGLVEFPSFHTISCMLLVYVSRSNKFLLACAIAYAGLVIGSTPLFGGHYFIDIFAGALVAIASCGWFSRAARKSRTIGSEAIA